MIHPYRQTNRMDAEALKKLDPGVAQHMRSRAWYLESKNPEAVEDALWDLFKEYLKGVRWLQRKSHRDRKEDLLLHHWIDFIQRPLDLTEVKARAELAEYLGRFGLTL